MAQASPSMPRADESHLADILAGTPYRAVRLLGRGGMGAVFDAEHVALGKPVVVKLLRSDLAQRPDLVDRMRVEAQALARLAHPNLVAVTDFGRTPAGRTFFVMERLVGRTLRAELDARGALPAPEAIALMAQVLAGLGAAHAAGIVHRDVKPANLFVCAPASAGAAPLVKVLDFGIAKVLAGAATSADASGAPALLQIPTEAGAWVGTPGYAAPEQLLGTPVAPTTDVYAAGLVLYEMVAGRHPFADAPDAQQLCLAQIHRVPPPPSRVAQGPVPPWLDHVVLRAIAKSPADRFASASALADALLAVARSLEPAGAIGGPSPAVARGTPPPPHPPLDAQGAAMSAPTEPAHRAAPTSAPTAPLRGVAPPVAVIHGAPAVLPPTRALRASAAPVIPATAVGPSVPPHSAAHLVAPVASAGYRDDPAALVRAQRLAVASLVLAAATLVWRAVELVHSVQAIADPIRYFAPMFGTSPPASVTDQITDLCARAVPAEIVRELALGACSVALVLVGARLWREGPRAAALVRAWTSWAFAATGLALLLNVAVMLPVQYEYQRLAMPYLATSNHAVDSVLTPSTMNTIAIIVVVVMPLVQLVWPTVLRVWAVRALRGTATAA